MIRHVAGLGRGVIALLLITLCGTWLPVQAWGHASLIATEPADGVILNSPPDQFTLRFNESVRPIVGRLTLPDRSTLLLKTPAEGADVLFELPELDKEGSYLLSWRATSADGHPVAGGAVFSIGHPTETAPVQTAAPLPTRLILWGARTMLIAGLLFGVAGVAFAHFAGRPVPAPTRLALLSGLAVLPVVALFQALDVLGQGPAALLIAAPWQELSRGAPALALLLAGVALLLALLAVHRPMLAFIALLPLAGSVAATGHAATAPPQVLMRSAVALHVMGAGFWIGALFPLIAGLRDRDAGQPLRRFGELIPFALVVLLASGVALSVVQLERVGALWTTPYGRILLAKLAMIAGLLALGLRNRIVLTPRALAGDEAPLIRAIRIEILLALLVIATLSLWRFTPPPRNLPPVSVPIQQVIGNDRVSASVNLGSNRAGPVAVTLSDIRLEGQHFTPSETRIEFSKPAYGLGPFVRTLPEGGEWLDAGSFFLPIDGFWVLRVTFLIDDFNAEEVTDIVTLEPAQ